MLISRSYAALGNWITTRLALLADDLRCSSSITSWAQSRQQPHTGSQSSDLKAVAGQAAPLRAAARSSSSRIALQTQTIMGTDITDNANHSQVSLWRSLGEFVPAKALFGDQGNRNTHQDNVGKEL